jgi:hypothetical protein
LTGFTGLTGYLPGFPDESLETEKEIKNPVNPV